MEKPQEEGQFNELGEMNFCNEAVFLDGETINLASLYHEGDLAFEAENLLNAVGGFVTGDAALYL